MSAMHFRPALIAMRWTEGRFIQATSTFAPMDVRVLLTTLCLVLAHKLLSFDFSALGELCERAPFFDLRPQWLMSILTSSRCSLFAGSRANSLAVAAALFLILTAIRPSRLLLAPAIIFAWIIDTGAAQFRYNMYTTDTPLALLTLLFLTPVKMSKAAHWHATPSRDAQIAMLGCLIFVATYYIQAGISKINFDWRWSEVVRVGNYYNISWLWHSQDMPDLIDLLARAHSKYLLSNPFADTFSAFVVLVEQFLWLGALLAPTLRFHAGVFAAVYHFMVMCVTGIAFVTWIPIALAVTAPLSSLQRWRTKSPGTELSNARADLRCWQVLYVAVLASLVAWVPAGGTSYPPFYNYLAFGWRYQDASEIKQIYRAGFRNLSTGAIDVIPLGHGAFLDFRHSGLLATTTEMLVKSQGNPAAVTLYKDRFESLLIAMRGPEANGWLLGRGKSVDHLLGKPGEVRAVDLTEFLLLKGAPVSLTEGRPWRAAFEVCGAVNFDRAQARAQFDVFPECRSE
jgi:hypothetical protein